MKSLAFFNNKGGVGKTTLTCNLAAYLAQERGMKVLVVDGDPQCNSTQLILSPELCNEMYWDADASSATLTLSNVVAPLEEGDIALDVQSKPLILAADNRFGVDLLAGHPAMSVTEDLLGKWWSDGAGGDLGALRKTNWVSMLLNQLGDYDLVIFDLGPSLGSLNRSILLATDYFVSPLAADTFSIVALRNIRSWIKQWGPAYQQSLTLARQNFADRVDQYSIQNELKVEKAFIGYTVQQYITKSKKGERRPTIAYERILDLIPNEIESTLAGYAAEGLSPDSLRLGDVPNLFSLIPLAQGVNAPIAKLKAADGLAGGQFTQQEDYRALMHAVGAAMADNLGIPHL